MASKHKNTNGTGDLENSMAAAFAAADQKAQHEAEEEAQQAILPRGSLFYPGTRTLLIPRETWDQIPEVEAVPADFALLGFRVFLGKESELHSLHQREDGFVVRVPRKFAELGYSWPQIILGNPSTNVRGGLPYGFSEAAAGVEIRAGVWQQLPRFSLDWTGEVPGEVVGWVTPDLQFDPKMKGRLWLIIRHPETGAVWVWGVQTLQVPQGTRQVFIVKSEQSSSPRGRRL